MQQMEDLRQRLSNCTACALCAERTNLVFGIGNPEAKVLLVGEAPGKEEDLRGEPFVGRSGKLLDTLLAAVDLSRESNVYIANMVKCRPPQNRDPLPAEQEACLPFLREQIKMMRPAVVVCVGRIAAQRLIDPHFRIMAQHGELHVRGEFTMTATLHPAALLRNPAHKELAFADWILIRRLLQEKFPAEYPKIL